MTSQSNRLITSLELVRFYLRGFSICNNSLWKELRIPDDTIDLLIFVCSSLASIFPPAASISDRLDHSLSHWVLIRLWWELKGLSHFFSGYVSQAIFTVSKVSLKLGHLFPVCCWISHCDSFNKLGHKNLHWIVCLLINQLDDRLIFLHRDTKDVKSCSGLEITVKSKFKPY